MTTALLPGTALAPRVPAPVVRCRRRLPPKLRFLPDAARNMGTAFFATRGAGKSRALGRLIAFQDFTRQVPLVVIDPIGGTIDNFLDKVNRRPLVERTELWSRIRYVNMNGQDGRVIPWHTQTSASARSASATSTFWPAPILTFPAPRSRA